MASQTSRRNQYQSYPAPPYVRSRLTTGDIMYVVVLALLPCAGVGMYHYGFHAALLIGISVGCAIAAELVCNLIRRRSSIYDYSCVVTGLIGGLILPPAAPLWYAAILSILAIVVFKHLFGGLGRNLFNPAMAGKLVLLLLFYNTMSDYGTYEYTDAAPLAMLSGGETPSLVSMLTGNTAGCIGTASAAAVLIAAVILLLMGIIDLYVPLAAIAAYAVLYAIFGEYGLSLYTQCVQICGGSFLFTVFIMAEDYTTSPMSEKGRIVYGLLIGALTFLFRQAGFAEEACVGALLIANAVRPLLDAKLAPQPFGAKADRWVVREPKRRSKPEPVPAQPSAAPAATNEDLDEDFAQFQEKIRRQTQGLETARYTGNDALLRDALADAGIPMDFEPAGAYDAGDDAQGRDEWMYATQQLRPDEINDAMGDTAWQQGGFESVVTDTSAIRPEAIRAALSQEEYEDGSYGTGYIGRIPAMPKMPQWDAISQPFTMKPAGAPAKDSYSAPSTGSYSAPAAGSRASRQSDGTPAMGPYTPPQPAGGPQKDAAGPAASPRPDAREADEKEEPVSYDTDMLEVEAILRAEREMHRANEEEFAGLDFIDLGRDHPEEDD